MKKKNAHGLNICCKVFCCDFKFVVNYAFLYAKSAFPKHQSSQKNVFFPSLAMADCACAAGFCFITNKKISHIKITF